ncbi:MAG: endopeptidase La [Anaerolineaceae bacterium]|nr:MAG: endopeptidase La [Anaerolineaceae bacterium]
MQNAPVAEDDTIELPVIVVDDTVVFPSLVSPINGYNPISISAMKAAKSAGSTVIVSLARNGDEDITAQNVHHFATETALGRLIALPSGEYATLGQGRRRVEIIEFKQTSPYLIARARICKETFHSPDSILALEDLLLNLLEEAAQLDQGLPDDMLDYAILQGDQGWMADFVANSLAMPLDVRQQVLEALAVDDRLEIVIDEIDERLDRVAVHNEITGRTNAEMARTQREIYLREQMRVIQGELGDDDIYAQEIDELREQIATANMPPAVNVKAMKELARLQQTPPMAPEVGVIRGYLDWLVAIPWHERSEDNLDVSWAQKILDDEHYGLRRVKDRILEHIAVRKLAHDKMKTPILCFVGPPGVGKTSMGRSIARALGREFVRVSLGGVRDEAEIRGHRRTYIGAMPGRIIQTMKNAGTVNPVFMLDEIDKLGADFRGDPAAALLEALDPEQNSEYSDHYIDAPYDLSRVMFVTTANDLYPIGAALLDRMEVIEFPSYTEDDKLEIARAYLIPQQLESHGIGDANIRFETDALVTIIREYTYEAGVRNLNREIGAMCRKIARLIAEQKRHPKRIKPTLVNRYLGAPQFLELRANDQDAVGIATGLAWTPNGGDILTIEVSVLPGKGNLLLTGQLGDVMQESAQAALSYMRARAADLDVSSDDFDNYDVHIHLPEGAIPKDGPSAGVTLATAIISAFTERPVRANWAMTGEITLRGRVLPVGGVKEKLLAAHRNRIYNVLLPENNRKDLEDVPQKALKDLNVCFVENMQTIIDTVLLDPPEGGRLRDADQQDVEDEDDS